TYLACVFRRTSREHHCSIQTLGCHCSLSIILWGGSDSTTRAASIFSKSTRTAPSCMTCARIRVRQTTYRIGSMIEHPLTDRDWKNGSPRRGDKADHVQNLMRNDLFLIWESQTPMRNWLFFNRESQTPMRNESFLIRGRQNLTRNWLFPIRESRTLKMNESFLIRGSQNPMRNW